MRIVHILTRLLRAGSEENTLLTCAGQLRAGHEVVLMYGHENAPDFAEALAPGAEQVPIADLTREVHPVRDAAAFRDIRRRLEALSPDIVHTHQSKAGIVGRFAASAAGVPTIVHGVHIVPFVGETGLKRALYLRAELAAARVTSGFIHVSGGVRKTWLQHGIGARSPHYVVRSGFDLRRFSEAAPPEDWRTLLRLEPGAPKPTVIAMLAALEPRKRHLELLDQLPALIAGRPDIRVVFAGEGHLRDEIAARIAALDLERQVVLLGFREDPERIIALSDICVHCADKEGLPRSVLQYLTARRPVLMFHLPGIEDVVSTGTNGLVVAQGDWPKFMDALAALVRDPGARAGLARGAGATDLRPWDASAMSSRTLEAYDDLIFARSGSPQAVGSG
jgi:glycosyltransferase involved in cell wall biosynthesis